ncbi:hypothetical protein AUK22_02095 [bacterium CG2_30_54_10]|nr:MAG: hypothetical protein AUK22_02095 [bacterium CG2_30_54_10]
MTEEQRSLPVEPRSKGVYRERGVLAWLGMVACFGVVPALLLMLGAEKILSSRLEIRENIARQRMQRLLEAYAPAAQGGRFWGSLLNILAERVRKQIDPEDYFQRKFPAFCRKWGISPIVVAWNGQGQLVEKSVPWGYSDEEWKEVWMGLTINQKKELDLISKPLHRKWFATMRKILGKQLLRGKIRSASGSEGQPVLSSIQSRWPYFWYWLGERFGFLLFLPADQIDRSLGLRRLISIHNRKAVTGRFLGLAAGERIEFPGLDSSPGLASEAVSAWRGHGSELENSIGSGRFLFEAKFLSAGLHLVAFTLKDRVQGSFRWLSWLGPSLALLVLLLAGAIARRIVIPPGSAAVSVKAKLAFLFFFANGLPLLVMLFLGYDYLAQKRKGLESEAQKSMGEFLETFDRRFPAWNIRYESAIEEVIVKLRHFLGKRELDAEVCNEINRSTSRLGIRSFFLIASGSPLMATEMGLTRGESVKRSLSAHKAKDDPAKKEERKFISLMGRRILREINGDSEARKGIDDIGLLAESFLQKSLVELIHDFFSALNKITLWGFGKSKGYLYIAILQTSGKILADYFFLITWGPQEMQNRYLRQSIPSVNRNGQGFRLVIRLRKTVSKSPVLNLPRSLPRGRGHGFKITPEITRFCGKLGAMPARDPETIVYKGRRYLAAGIKGKELDRFISMTFLPEAKLDSEIREVAARMIGFGVLNLFVTLILVRLLGRKFLEPVEFLAEAALAIEHRRFDHRLPALGNDEFGDLGRIFNRVLVGLEELHVAKVVQGSLFPEKSLEAGGFRVYGKSVAMGELGGDYFDYFHLDADRFGVLIGDVEGHGLPAALTMAMARAVVLRFSEESRDPSNLLKKLNELILETQAHGKGNTMTFLYACIDWASRRAVLANAGHCPPLMIRSRGKSTEWLELPSQALGTCREPVFPTIEVPFEPGDSLVLYTDGLVAAADPGKRVLGFPGAAEMAMNSWSEDPEKFYARLMSGWLKHLGGQNRQDDLTVVIIVYQPNFQNPVFPQK